jgi:hypothetical protein
MQMPGPVSHSLHGISPIKSPEDRHRSTHSDDVDAHVFLLSVISQMELKERFLEVRLRVRQCLSLVIHVQEEMTKHSQEIDVVLAQKRKEIEQLKRQHDVCPMADTEK